MTPADLYRTCRVSAQRLETRQRYIVGASDDERMRAFLAGEPLPPPGPGKVADLELIASLRQRGVYVGRVHLVDRPLSDYIRYELAVYAENEAAGETVLIADRSVYPELLGLSEDFALFDSQTVILFNYDDRGKVETYSVTAAPAIVEQHQNLYGMIAKRAVPLADFMAAASL